MERRGEASEGSFTAEKCMRSYVTSRLQVHFERPLWKWGFVSVYHVKVFDWQLLSLEKRPDPLSSQKRLLHLPHLTLYHTVQTSKPRHFCST